MRLVLLARAIGGAFAALALGHGPAVAQATEATPVIVIGTADVNLNDLPLTADGQKAIIDLEAAMKAGTVLHHVMAGSADGQQWDSATSTKSAPVTVLQLARQTLESCEYVNGLSPCYIYEVDGKDARDATGSWPPQPHMIEVSPGSAFEAARIPFITASARDTFARWSFPNPPQHRVVVVTSTGNYASSGGKDTIADAVADAMKQCTTSTPNQTCLLYSINDTVVFTP